MHPAATAAGKQLDGISWGNKLPELLDCKSQADSAASKKLKSSRERPGAETVDTVKDIRSTKKARGGEELSTEGSATGHWWLMPPILAAWEAEIKRIKVWGQHA
jgi:hypothetical protein